MVLSGCVDVVVFNRLLTLRWFIMNFKFEDWGSTFHPSASILHSQKCTDFAEAIFGLWILDATADFETRPAQSVKRPRFNASE